VTVAAFITTQRAEYHVPQATSCRALGVSQAWYYKWRDGDPSPRRARREQLTVEVKRLFAAHHGRWGSPRVTDELRVAGWRVAEKTVAAIMAEQHLAARPKRRRRSTTRQGRGRWRAPDLIGRDFAADGVNRKWYGDGTEIPTDEGKLYLDSVLDVGSRRIVGFAMDVHHDTELAHAAVAMAVAVRGGKEAISGVIMHTDQGSEYTAGRFRAACTRMGITQSMGRVGSALDNAVIESWHSTLEFELRAVEHFTTRAQARARVASWIDEYNHDRKHSACRVDGRMRSPIDYETANLGRQGTATPTQPPASARAAPERPEHGAVLAGVKATPYRVALRPALTPAAGGTGKRPSGAGKAVINTPRST
jgi:putative transposase